MEIISIILWLFLLLLGGSIVSATIKNGISPMPSSPRVKRHFLETLPKTVTGKIYELGAGWGTLAFPLARKYPQCQVIAYEISWVPYLFCRLRKWWSGLDNIEIYRKDFYKESLSDAALIVCYLYPGAMRKLKEKFIQELRHKTLIVSHTFAIQGWEPLQTYAVDDIYRTQIYHYVI